MSEALVAQQAQAVSEAGDVSETQAALEAQAVPAAVQVVIHVRFAADGTVTEIGERPSTLSAQDWFNRLSRQAGNAFKPLSGGRGIFRLERAQVDALKAASPN